MRAMILILMACLPAVRADWRGFVRARAAAGADDLAIRKELVRPSVLLTTNTVAVAKDPARIELEAAAIDAINALFALVAPEVPAEDRVSRVAGMKAKQLRDVIRARLPGLTVANQREVQNLVAELLTYYAVAPDLWPPAPDFGQATREVEQVVREPGPSRYDILRSPEDPAEPPSLEEIRAAMSGEGENP